MKVLTVIGARPQFIKAAALSREISNTPGIVEIMIHTGQHFDKNMSHIFFDQMHIPKPDYNLAINSLNHGAMTGRMIERIEEIILHEQPGALLVYGDTNSTLAGALAAAKLHIPVAHVEAGIRSFNKRMPEEINRICTDHVSTLLFCPTQHGIDNLKNEGLYDKEKVILTGDIMYDSSMLFKKFSQEPTFKLPPNFILSTIHRAENTDSIGKLKGIIEGLNKMNETVPVIMPIHPRTEKFIIHAGIKVAFQTIEPVGYLEMIHMLKSCSLVLTDSGGLQKEAYFFKKPCVTIRDQTEWVELVENGANILANAEANDIIYKTNMMLNKDIDYNIDLYGDGHSAKKIVAALLKLATKPS